MNLFILLSALGLSHSIFGERLLPVGTLYDPFIERGLDALNYACYQDARFLMVATPSGVTLAPEGGAHQSIGTPLIGMAQDGLASFEPAFVDELAIIMRWAFDYMQRGGDGEPASPTGCATRPAVRSTSGFRPGRRAAAAQIGPGLARTHQRRLLAAAAGAQRRDRRRLYGRGRAGGDQAVGLMAEDRRDVGLLAVTSADRLNAGWTAASRAREHGLAHARSHVERLLGGLPQHCGLVTVLDGHPATLAWLGSVLGHRTRTLGVEHFGQTGTIADLYRHFGIDVKASSPPPKRSRRIGRSGCCAPCPDPQEPRRCCAGGSRPREDLLMKRFRLAA